MREYRLMEQALGLFGLDLRGRKVLTEAASNAFLWTPLLAALAGAEVVAVAGESRHATMRQVIDETSRHARALGLAERIDIRAGRTSGLGAGAEIVTNLGFVRPIDADVVGKMEPDGIVCLMWEPWEFRPGEIDLDACARRGIAVLGTNERDPRLRTFSYVGLTVIKLLLERGVEVLGSQVLLLGSGPFVEETARQLRLLGASVHERLEDCPDTPDCAVCLEHSAHDQCLVGEGGLLDLGRCEGRRIPLILHVCGKVDMRHVEAHGGTCIPALPARCGYMSFSTAYVGPKPVIDLHAAGLRIGQAWLERDTAVLDALALPLPQYPCLPAAEYSGRRPG